jgi:hypothetical protein
MANTQVLFRGYAEGRQSRLRWRTSPGHAIRREALTLLGESCVPLLTSFLQDAHTLVDDTFHVLSIFTGGFTLHREGTLKNTSHLRSQRTRKHIHRLLHFIAGALVVWQFVCQFSTAASAQESGHDLRGSNEISQTGLTGAGAGVGGLTAAKPGGADGLGNP